MKKILFLLLATGGLLIATTHDADASHRRRGWGRCSGYHSFRTYPRTWSSYSHYPIRRGISFSIGSGYYGGGVYGEFVPSYSYGPIYGRYGGYCH